MAMDGEVAVAASLFPGAVAVAMDGEGGGSGRFGLRSTSSPVEEKWASRGWTEGNTRKRGRFPCRWIREDRTVAACDPWEGWNNQSECRNCLVRDTPCEP